ncbi:MAG TPA: ATP-binding cassette domain-containing protein [Gammaproteobacteria bacterium]|nr:ATP-binding cassette domain-containing protein [Gammaproteobacteria bacterium]
MDDVALETLELTKRFGKFTAVNELSFTVHKQDVFGLIGPNGAGKSTLMKMLTTILPPTLGDALVGNLSIINNPASVREIIGYVPQLISADGTLTGYENLLLFAKLYHIPPKQREKRIQESLETMGLTGVANRFVHEYSGGMIRRLEIIQALLHKPKVLFLDEPTTGLDPVARKVVWEHLQAIHKRDGITIVITTHDMQEAEFLCNKIAIMLHGQIAALGTPQKLKAEINEHATLNDVFIKYAGHSIEMENAYKEISSRRRTESKRG